MSKPAHKPTAVPTSNELIAFLDGWRQKHVVVVGDFMLDRYVYGDADRLSPDAPVPVLAARRTQQTPGGAANVCLDLLALGCKVSCLGVVGADAAGKELRKMLAGAGCRVEGLMVCPRRPTTVKHNFVGLAQHRHPQKMFRVDEEDAAPLTAVETSRAMARARKLVKTADVLCVEDYAKGVLTGSLCPALIDLASRRGVPVLVDPAADSDYSRYRGASVITPNRTEAALATGIPFEHTSDAKVLQSMAATLLRRTRAEAIVMTLDREGLLLARRGRKPLRVPTQARSVYDVSGAGDMVLAMLAAALANGADWRSAVELANVAAGLEVERFGAVPVELDEVLLSLLGRQQEQMGKCRQLNPLLTELAAYRKRARRIVFTNGCFDILHAGHVAFLREARSFGDLLVVGLNSDASIRRLKGLSRPVNHVEDRLMVLSELQSVDYVVVFDEDTPMKLIKAVRPDVLVKGAGYRKSQVVGADFVEAHGGKVRLVKPVKGRSTTNIIRRIEGSKGG
jgi:D-beta-D-heptose 7-phosphate kinase/D-beta-D-heptose 1-phosphate adenosyltransferase